MLRRIVLVTLAVALVISSPASASPAPPLDVRHVDLRVRLDFGEGRLTGSETLTIENRGDSPVSVVPLNLNRLMKFSRVADAAGTLKIASSIATFEDEPRLQVNHAAVTLRRPLAAHAKTTITVDFSGYVAPYTETGSLYIRDSIDETFTIIRRDAYAFPVIETLSAKANRATPLPSFTFDARVTVPSSHVVATGGRLVDSTVRGDSTTFHFATERPVPFLNIAVARYRTLERNGARIYYFPEDAAGAERIADKSAEAIELLTSWFGPLASAPEFTIIEIPEGFGSQAELTAGIIQTANAFRNAESMQELYHELSHFWAVPDTDVPSPRWNEGLATYLSRRIAASVDGKDGSEEAAKRTAARLVGMVEREPRLATVPFVEYGRHEMTDFAYGTGFLMFYALEKQVGPDVVLRALRDYFQEYKTRGAGFAEFTTAASRASGRDLTPFFDEWARTTRWLERLKRGESAEQIGR